jgi:Rod binding domain-containing protein
MNISPLDAQVKVSQIPLERMAANGTLSEQEKIGELSRQFEAVLLRQILRDATKTVFKSKFSEEGVESDIYHDMVTTRLADCISQSKSVGLARNLETELTRQLLPQATEADEP